LDILHEKAEYSGGCAMSAQKFDQKRLFVLDNVYLFSRADRIGEEAVDVCKQEQH
jgi:hypothetical protein